MATTISTQDLENARRDIDDIGKAVNENVIVDPRYGADFKSLPMIAAAGQALIDGFDVSAQTKLNEWESAIALITQEGGVPALAVSDAGGDTQQNINDYNGSKWRNKAGGYDLNARVMLNNGDVVKSTVAGNTANPNADMTGWVDTSAAQNIKNSLGGSVQDFIDQQLQTNTFLSNISVAPEMFGAKGNGIDDDTVAFKAWWESSHKSKAARGKYKVDLGDVGSTFNLYDSMLVDMQGAEIIPMSKARYLLRVNVIYSNKYLHIIGGHCDCLGLIARPLEVNGDGRLAVLTTRFFNAINVAEDAQNFSAIGLRFNVLSDNTCIANNGCYGVSRTSVNAGVITCAGISVARVDSTCLIYGNNIEDISTPTTADADGIVVFSENRLVTPSEVQAVNVRVFNNRMKNCAGRFVKMQSPGKVYTNDFRSESGALIPEFRAVDAQNGGVDVFDNDWRLSAGVTLGTNSMFYFYQAKGGAGSEENTGYCRDNKLYLGQKINYLAHVDATGGRHSVDIQDNIIKDEDGLVKVNDMVRLSIADASAIDSIDLSIKNNSLTLGTSGLLIVTGAGFANSTLNNKLNLTIKDNHPKGVVAGAKVIENTPEAVNPYLGDLLISNNGSQLLSFNQIIARGIDVLKLRSGNQFYYATDGGAGGLLNTPSAYNRYVYVNVNSSSIELTGVNGQKKAVKGNTATWYEYTGTALS